jgi:hypothetical protein
MAPSCIAFKDLLLNAFVIKGRGGETFKAGKDEVLFSLGAT